MAQGDFIAFDQTLLDMAEKQHDFELDTFNLGYITAAVTPVATTADPHWGGTGTTNFATNQVATGGNYSGPLALANPSAALVGGLVEIDYDDPAQVAQNAANATNFTWGIVYNDTLVAKKAVAFVDLGGAFDGTTGDLDVVWGTPAITLNQA